MAKERMVTRTVQEAKVVVMTVNVLTQQVGQECVTISATIGKNKALSYIQNKFQTEEIKIVAIISYTVTETLYGMPEQAFIKFAEALPSRVVKE